MIVPGKAYLVVMASVKAKLILAVLMPLLLVSFTWSHLADRDEALVGKWRGATPTGPEDEDQVWEFRFDKKGKVAVFRVMYEWDAESQSWGPATADQPAQGDNDEWRTENGYFTIEIRERYMTNRDLVCRYRIGGDTLHLHMAEIFRPVEGNNKDMYGNWRMETYDQSYPKEKRIREITIEEAGVLTEKAGEKEFKGRIIPVEGGWKQLVKSENGASDTLFQPAEVRDGNLYLYQKAEWLRLYRRK